jgi:hypothetical protein
MVQYTADFSFKDGLYIEFVDFKNNNPIPVTHIISDLDIRSVDYLEQVLQSDSVKYYDNLLEERSIAVNDLWGFCQKGRVFIGFGANSSYNNPAFFDFYPLINIGAISFFSAMESYYRTMSAGPNMGVGFRDPMMMNDNMTVTESEQVQLLLHFETGKVLLAKRGELGSIPVELVSQLIKSDPAVLSEFESLSGRDQKQKGMFYIRKYNERNPIFFPE